MSIKITNHFGIGSWRMLLAVLVAASHLWADMLQGYAAYAVWGFYVLSGYLMTYVVSYKYGFTVGGLRNFAFNRLLRIYPSYYVAFAFGVVAIMWLNANGVNSARLNPEMGLPVSFFWINPITLLPIFPRTSLPVAVSSALSIEIGAYFLIPIMARWVRVAWLTLAISGIYSLSHGLMPASFADRYALFLPCLMTFTTGSLVCHYRESLLRWSMPCLSVLIWLLHGLIWLYLSSYPWTIGLYASMLLSAWVTLSLTSQASSKVDAVLGDMSYPMYLLHTIVGALLLAYFGYDRAFSFFLTSFVITLLLAWLMAIGFERKLHRFKREGRRAAAAPSSANLVSSSK
ncbi:acyltransferase family protein [Xanthomonas campestris]|uniref:Acyltransferase n=1 Tax=Xanthomonas campestris pv. papavericola TaxID=487881 RepID=A0AAJ2X421_XANCA|nr:acyltransferase [Xanthomonas campestris]MEC3888279.1 acyltransferase [Xanthomonas campestris pv. papavericola]